MFCLTRNVNKLSRICLTPSNVCRHHVTDESSSKTDAQCATFHPHFYSITYQKSPFSLLNHHSQLVLFFRQNTLLVINRRIFTNKNVKKITFPSNCNIYVNKLKFDEKNVKLEKYVDVW